MESRRPPPEEKPRDGPPERGAPGGPVSREAKKAPRPLRLNRVASVLFAAAFVLGVLNAAVAIIGIAGVSTPEETHGSGTCELAGEVRDAAGRPIACATVLVTDASLSALTDSSGWYVIKGIPAGTHRVEATAPGYNRMSVRVDLRPNLLKSLDFTLEYGGADVNLDEASGESFSGPAGSFLWAVPLLLSCSVCALAAALLSLDRDRGRLALALGAASVLSLGFGVGSVLAGLGVVLVAIHMAGWPRVRRAGRPAGAHATRGTAPSPGASGSRTEAEAPGASPPSGAPPAAARATAAKGGGEGGAAAGKIAGIPARHAVGRRRPGRERALCCVCIEEILPGQRYIKCVCGRRMHVGCIHEPECPECGHPFGGGR